MLHSGLWLKITILQVFFVVRKITDIANTKLAGYFKKHGYLPNFQYDFRSFFSTPKLLTAAAD